MVAHVPAPAKVQTTAERGVLTALVVIFVSGVAAPVRLRDHSGQLLRAIASIILAVAEDVTAGTHRSLAVLGT